MQGRGQQEQGTEQIYAPLPPSSGHREKDSQVRGRSLQAELMRAAPLLLVSLLLLVAIWWDGAFDMRYWAPLALLALALLCALSLSGAVVLPERGPLAVALVAIWAFAAYAMLSAAWAESAADAWEGAARMTFYAALFSIAVVAPATDRGRRWVGLGLVAGVVAVGLVMEVVLLADGADAFLAGRLDAPIGYRNGTAALFAFAVWPLIGIAARRGVASGLRAFALAAAVMLAGLAFLRLRSRRGRRGRYRGRGGGPGVALCRHLLDRSFRLRLR
jgi:hypothetical protein